MAVKTESAVYRAESSSTTHTKGDGRGCLCTATAGGRIAGGSFVDEGDDFRDTQVPAKSEGQM